MPRKTIWATPMPNGYAVVLLQTGNKYAVQYGKQLDEGLTYEKAAAKIGEAVMHALQCEGKLIETRMERLLDAIEHPQYTEVLFMDVPDGGRFYDVPKGVRPEVGLVKRGHYGVVGGRGSWFFGPATKVYVRV